MDNFIVASPESIFNLFGCGFLAGSLFGFTVMLSYEFISNLMRSRA